MASNALTVGGINLNKKAEISIDDGCFELVLIRKGVSDILNAQVMLSAVVQGVEHNKFIEYARTRKLKVTSDEDLSWTLDGEFGGDVHEATIECIEKKLKIIVPRWTLDVM